MNRNTRAVVGLVLLIAVLLVAIGYAAITAVTLNINGSAQATPEQTNFTVKFSGTPTVSDSSKVVAVINQQDQLKATMNVNGLTAKGDTTTITVTVELIKTPITQDEETTIGVTITAEPQQPNA